MIFAGLLAIAGFAYYGAHRGIDKTERVAEQAARAELGRDIDVRSPGPLAERFDKPQLEGRVDLGPDGRPKPYTKLSPKTVAECLARKALPTVAGALRLDPEEIRAVAAYQVQVLEPKLGPQYQGGTC